MDLLWTDFLNSDWRDWRGTGRREDRLENPQWLRQFLDTWKLQATTPLEPGELAALKEFRGRLRAMADTLALGESLGDADFRELNRVMDQGPVIRRITRTDEGQRLDFLPLQPNWTQVMAEIAASFAGTLAGGDGGRVRFCANPDCLWVFYDDTRNRNKRFCEDKLCGNLMKVRRFRARRRGSYSGPETGPECCPDDELT